jgi:sigma-E factor negative regulatory protein RseA
MNETQQTLLSAFVDGEMTEKELDQFLAAVRDNPAIKTAYMDMQHTSDMVKGYTSSIQPTDLSQRLSPLLESEPVHRIEPSDHGVAALTHSNDFWKQIAGLSLAALVGASFMGMMNSPSLVNEQPYQFVEVAPVSEPLTTQVATSATGNRWTVGENEVQDRLNDYLVDHNEYGSPSGVLSYARVVSYSEE